MDTSIENEEKNSDYHLESNPNHEITFSDWQFVDKYRSVEQGSDDDSIEVIEREISIPFPDFDPEESEIEELFKDFANDGNEADFAEIDIRPIAPCNKCLSCPVSHKTLVQQRSISSGITWNVLFSFVLGVLASLVFQEYKSYIPNGMRVFPLSDAFNLADGYPFSFTNEEHEITMPAGSTKEDDELTRMCNHCDKQKTILDNTLMKTTALMKHARQFRDDIYFFEISKLASGLIDEQRVMSRLDLEKPVLPCENNVTSEQLPLVCKNGHVFLVFVKESQVINLHNSILRFYDDIEGRAFAFYENIITSLTKSVDPEKITDNCHTRILVHDWDGNKENYRSPYCSFIGSDGLSIQSQKLIEDSWQFDELRFSEGVFAALTKLMQSDEAEVGSNVDCRTCRIFEEVIDDALKTILEKESKEHNYVARVELNKFVESCRPCGLPESTSPAMRIGLTTGQKHHIEENESKETVGHQERKKPILGEWWFNLHRARAKLRSYYESVASVDWFLKLGRARGKLRFDRGKDYRSNGDSQKTEKAWKEYQGQYWYKKKIEKFQLKFKTYMDKWKRHFKVATESITRRFKELKSKFKNKSRK